MYCLKQNPQNTEVRTSDKDRVGTLNDTDARRSQQEDITNKQSDNNFYQPTEPSLWGLSVSSWDKTVCGLVNLFFTTFNMHVDLIVF